MLVKRKRNKLKRGKIKLPPNIISKPVKVVLESQCLKIFINGVKYSDSCSYFDWWFRLTFNIRNRIATWLLRNAHG